MAQRGWVYDNTRCIGCYSCAMACKMEQNTPVGVNLRWVIWQEGGAYPTPSRRFVSVACNHCAEPACMKSCPTDAITKAADGKVLIDADRCVGCKYCLFVCPYGAPQFNEADGKVYKCSFCKERVDAGLLPACVNACQGRALRMAEDLTVAAGNEPEGFAKRKYTKPSINFEV